MAELIGILSSSGGLIGSLSGASLSGSLAGVIPMLQEKSHTPTETATTITADEGYTGLSKVDVGAIPSDYVGSDIPRQTELHITANSITAPAGFYAEDISDSVQTGTEGTPTASKSAVDPATFSVTVTPSVTNTAGYISGGTHTGTPVTVAATELVSGTKLITENVNSSNVATYKYVRVNVQPSLQSQSATPTETAQTITADSGYYGMDKVSISAIPSDYVGSSITTRTSLSVSGRSVSGQAGYYPSAVSANVAQGAAGTPTASKGAVSNHAITVTPKVVNTTGYITGSTITGTAVTVSASELVSGTKNITANTSSDDVTNYKYVSVNVAGPSLQSKTATPLETAVTVTPDAGYDGLDQVTVSAISSTYVGSAITTRSSLSVSGRSVTANAGYYPSAVTASVSSATGGTPTATKSAVNNHAITVTPKVTNPTGYITASTITGTAVTVSASELVSGTKSITANTTSSDVTNYKYVDVNVPVGIDLPTFTATMDGGGNISITCDKTYAECVALANDNINAALLDAGRLAGMQLFVWGADYITYEQTSIDSGISISTIAITYHSDNTITFTTDNINSRDSTSLLVSGATVTAEAGWYETNISKAVASGSVAVTATTATVNPSISVSTAGVITASVNGSKSVGATVQTGYVSSASSGTVTITGSTSTSLTTTAGTHLTPTTTAQTAVPAYRYTTGSVIVDAIPSSYVQPSGTYTATTNTSGVDIGNYKYLTVNVSGGGGGKNVQVQHGTKRVNATAYTDVGYEITVAKAGTYNIYWAGWRTSTSGTSGAQVYVNGVASGSAVTTFDGTWTNVQNGSRTSVSLSQGDKVTLRARSRNTSYYMYIFFLSIEEV